MKSIPLLILCLTILTVFACNKKEIIPDLIECWDEIEPEEVIQFSGTNHIFCFINDTDFTIEISRWTDALPPSDCESRTEYISGTYQWIDSGLEMDGIYTTSDFSTPDTNCIGNTNFQRDFTIDAISETEILLNRNDEYPALGIRLLKN